MITHDIGVVKDKLAELLDTLNNLARLQDKCPDCPDDYLVIDSCLNGLGEQVIRFDVVKQDKDGIKRIHRTQFNVDTFRQ